MFYKINPAVRQMFFDLGADGFIVGDKVWVDLQGDFQPTHLGSLAKDNSQNTNFQLGTKFIGGGLPATVTAKDTVLVANNLDDPLVDNTDPDKDYGVRVKLAAFSEERDFFRFKGREALPDQIKGSIYKAGGGNDSVVMPDAPVRGFDTNKIFYAGAGNDKVTAGKLDLKVNFGTGVDTFVLKGGIVGRSNPENRDNDGTLVVKTAEGHRYKISNAEIIKDGNKQDVLAKWYFGLKQGDDGQLTVKFFENGKLVSSGKGFYDEALPVSDGLYNASFRNDGWQGERVVLSGVSGFGEVVIRSGSSGGSTQTDFVTTPAFLKAVFSHIDDAYGLAGRSIPWKQGALNPLVPVTVAVRGDVEQPFLKVRNLVTDDDGNAVVNPRFTLMHDGDVAGLAYKSIQVFFKLGGNAERGVDWDFANGTKAYNGNDFAAGVLRQGRDGEGDMVYSVMLERGAHSLAVPLRIVGDKVKEGTEKIVFEVVDIDLWRHTGSTETLYNLSGGPKADQERDFDGPTGLENRLLPDDDFVVTIHDHLV